MAGEDDGERGSRRGGRAPAPGGVRVVLSSAVLALGVIGALAVVAELVANVLRVRPHSAPLLALAAVVGIGAVAAARGAGQGRPKRGRPLSARARTEDSEPPSRRSARWRRRLGGGGPAPRTGERASRRRRRRGHAPTSSDG